MDGKRLRRLREEKGMSQIEFAKAMSISNVTVSQYEKGIRNPDEEMLLRIANYFDVTTDYLLGNSMEPKHTTHVEHKKKGVRIPVLGEIRAGIPIEAITDIIDYEDISEEMAAGGEFFGLRVKGDSMVPVLLEGDTIIVRQQPAVENGETAIVSINGDEATVKRVKYNQDGSMLLIPNNPAYDTLYYSKEEVAVLPVRVLGKVVEIRRKL